MPLRKSRVLPFFLYKNQPLRRSKSDPINKKNTAYIWKLILHDVLTSETKGHLGDDSAGDGETNEERPVTAPFTAEENRPWIELPHIS